MRTFVAYTVLYVFNFRCTPLQFINTCLCTGLTIFSPNVWTTNNTTTSEYSAFDSFSVLNHTDQHFFGSVQAIDGAWAVIGAPGLEQFDSHGVAFIYRKFGKQWLLHTTLQSDTPTPNDEFGSQVSISGNQILIGSSPNFSESVVDIFELNERKQWLKTAGFKTQYFGQLIAHDRDQIILGSSAKVFKKVNLQWIQTHEFFPNSFELKAISVNKNQVIFGFDKRAEIHTLSNNQWQLTNTLHPDDVTPVFFSEFGSSVSIHENWAIVGDFHDNENGTHAAGAAYIYQNIHGDWQQQEKLLLSTGEAGDFFGFQVNNRKDQFIINTVSPRNSGSFHFKQDKSGVWQETALLANTNFNINSSLDHAISCSNENKGTCVIFTTPIFKAGFD